MTAKTINISSPHSKDSQPGGMREGRIENDFLWSLLGCLGPADVGVLKVCAKQIDWAHLFAITPPDLYGYLGQKLSALGLDSLCPIELLTQTVNFHRVTTAQWLRFSLEIRQLAHSFNQHDVDFMLVKGAVLAFNAYSDHTLRPMSDIDFFVRPECLERALDVVYAAGYTCPDRHSYRPPQCLALESFPNRIEVSVPLQKPGTRSLIEVHTQLAATEPWFRVNPELMWANCEETFVAGIRVKTLEKHDFLFQLVLHLSRVHLFDFSLRALLDIHLWVELHKDRLDWEWLASEAIRRGYADWLHLTLRVASDLLRTSIPPRFFVSMPRPPQFERLQQLACELMEADRKLDHRVGSLASILGQASARKAIARFSRRFLSYGRRSDVVTVPEIHPLRSAGVRIALRRATAEMRIKLPKYVRAWRNGTLRWSSLKQAARLIRDRAELQDILATRMPL